VIRLAILISLAVPLAALAQEARVRIVFRTDNAGNFEHRSDVRGLAAQRLSSPTPADLKPYVTAAQKALAERQGYGERIFGADNHRLARGRIVETTVTDPSGRTLWTSREPLEGDVRFGTSVARQTFEPQDTGDGDLGFAKGGRGKPARSGGTMSRAWPFIGR
jgi:hypothetical protein